MLTVIRQPQDFDEKESIYRFRYKVYVEEMQRRQKDADHRGKRIEDNLDVGGFTLAAWQDGKVVGTIRNNCLEDPACAQYRRFYDVASADGYGVKTTITTRLMVAPEKRCSTLATRLAIAVYEHALQEGVTRDFIDCNDHLVPYFTALGYQMHRRNAIHPEYGRVSIMRLDLDDLDYLEEIRSPFQKRCAAFLDSQVQSLLRTL